MKPGKKEKIRYGKAPQETLPSAAKVNTEDAGAVQQAANTTPEPVNPLETNPGRRRRPASATRQIGQASQERDRRTQRWTQMLPRRLMLPR